jgi:hypothetical protein
MKISPVRLLPLLIVSLLPCDSLAAPAAGVVGPLGQSCCIISARPIDGLGSHRRAQPPMPTAAPESTLAGGTLTLRGTLDGEWDNVDGHVVFTYDFSPFFPDVGRLQIFVRGYPAQREGSSNRYGVEWDRSSYWLDFDGDGPEVPRMLPALELARGYVPQAVNDPYPEFAADPGVIAACTSAEPCTVQTSTYVLLREPGVDYSAYPDEAAPADLLFVANHLGQAIAAAVDVYDANNQFVETKDLVEGDELAISILAHKLSEPEFIYLIPYTGFVELAAALRIELANYIPGVDFNDSRLAPDLDAGNRRMKLLLEANRTVGGDTTWAYGGPFDLGFTWANALIFLHRSGFESPQAAPNAAPLVLKRD